MNKNITSLVEQLRYAYGDLEAAKIRVTTLEAELLSYAVPPATGEGTVTQEQYKVAYGLNVTVPAAQSKRLQDEWTHLGKNSQSAFRWKAEVDKAKFKAIKDLDAQAFAELAPFVVSKPAKPVITLLEG